MDFEQFTESSLLQYFLLIFGSGFVRNPRICGGFLKLCYTESMFKKVPLLGRVILTALLGFWLSVSPVQAQVRTDNDTPVTKRILMLSFNPILESQGNQRLSAYKGWTTGSYGETQMINELVSAINTASNGVVNYQVAYTLTLDSIPVKQDGFQYTDATYLDCLNNGVGCHTPDEANMQALLNSNSVCTALNGNYIDELWMFGAPYMGFANFMTAGPTSIGTNRYISGTACNRPLMISTFGYHTTVGQRFTNFHQRLVASQFSAWGNWLYGQTGFNTSQYLGKFMAYRGSNPDNIGCGFDHTTPNSTVENGPFNLTTFYRSICDDFMNFPFLDLYRPISQIPLINCSNWGCTEQGFVNWWMARLPRYTGRSQSKWNNWWRYVTDYDASVSYNSLNNDPRGATKSAGGQNCKVKGNACDPNNFSKTQTVDFYIGTTKVGQTVANIVDPTLSGVCGGTTNHAYDYTLTGLPAGTKRVYVNVRDVDSAGNETGVSVLLNSTPSYTVCQ